MNAQDSIATEAVRTVQPLDHIDIGNAFEFKAGLQEMVRRGPTRLVIDLSQVQYIDSAGLSALMAVVNACQGAGGAIRLCGLQPSVLKIFQLTRLDEYLPLAVDAAEAQAQLAALPPA
jgi:anti-sigma B factor antagonist